MDATHGNRLHDDVGEARIAAIIPVRNRPTLVVQAIESALSQTHAPEEVIVIDDGSTDGTVSVVRQQYPSVRVVEQEHSGAACARNVGVTESSSPWIAFLDSDDHWDPGHLHRMAGAIRETKGAAGFYFSDTIRPEEEGKARLWNLGLFELTSTLELREDATEWVMLARQPMMLQSSVFRRDAFLDCGGLDTMLPRRHDTHLFFKLGLGKPVCAVPGIGAVMTAEGARDRLTVSLDSSTKTYWLCTQRLYADVLQRAPTLLAAHRRKLRARLAASHRRLARFAIGDRRPLALLQHLAEALTGDPRELLRAVGRKLGG